MSGFIAVSVSLIGLLGVLFTLAIFIQMILSFPAMLSSNSQTYVQQQRKIYNISAGPGFEDNEADADAELQYEYATEKADDSVERWIDVVDEVTNDSGSGLGKTQSSQGRRRSLGARRTEPITRGRPLRRRRRTTTARPGLRAKNAWRLDDQSDCDFETEQVHEAAWQPNHDRQHCNPGWRKSMEWTR